ncbi:Abortive infection bacteriophage resistance protein [Streptococcus criceti]|uniref:Abi family protein n=1 Tax=Streptococcus criceti HS-6 TaxID=873449 RepID=G5JQ39_STRCG|nr:Abi family protein [Streptococcus criceti]EHI75548.1 hypothetical protein STRCR_0486 [Streptococcus criceti HS-6]SUN41947.1 Abortive infection bacteriophage resistance protein [Streptococcus criceti]
MDNLEGTISKLSTYYGIITFDEVRYIENETYKVKRNIPFFSSDLSQYRVGFKVSFSFQRRSATGSGNDLLVRGQSVQFAKNVCITDQTEEEQETSDLDFYQILNSKLTPSPNLTNESSFLEFLKLNNFRYSTFNEISVLSNVIEEPITISDFKAIIDYDLMFKEFIMKWVLFIENDVKSRIEDRASELGITESDLFIKLDSSGDNNFKNLIKNSLKNLRKNYLLRDIGDLRLQYDVTTDEIPKLESAPIDMLMDQFTVGDLLDFIDFITAEYPDFTNGGNTDWEKVRDYLSELKLVRNISAHGNSFLSAILDEKSNPNYLLEENSHIFGGDPFYIDTSKKTSVFHLVRSPIKLILKGQVTSPQQIAVFWTQKLLNNQTLRSFVYFYFMVCYLTEGKDSKEKFKNELRVLFGNAPKNVNFHKVIDCVNTHPQLDKEDKQNILNILIPQAINMFDYVKEHGYEYRGEDGDTIYNILYGEGKQIRINLSENAKWHLDMCMDIATKPLKRDNEAPSQWSESKEIRDKFGIFFMEASNARETLMRMFDSNLEIDYNEGIEQLLKIEEFKNIKILFLDILDLFN